MQKILIIGSGGLMIGQAGEFDYSTSQCLKALKEEGITTILINPNIATYQTSSGMADEIYFLPITPFFVEKVIKKEKPDGILLSFGGQTALNCGVSLRHVFEKYNVKVLGTPIQTIIDTEDRNLFVKKLNEIGVKTPRSIAAEDLDKVKSAASSIGYPVMLRSAYSLGGKGSGVARTEKELLLLAKKALSSAPQVLVEEYLGGWKEIEYEVVRDSNNNCVTICNMENFDPMGIHTGESIVVAPSQTLTNKEYHELRNISIRTIKHLGVVGECNIQFALNPKSFDYRVIEVNARLSRSSALASKATGYPLAFIAAKLSLGYDLPDLKNNVTKVTGACFEPALDYVVVKIPKWNLEKFRKVSTKIGSEMKSVGEVMSIGRTFEEALQKAVRMLNTGRSGLTGNDVRFDDLKQALKNPTDQRLFAVAEAILEGMPLEDIHDLTGIDSWFLGKIKNICDIHRELKSDQLNETLLKRAKQYGFSDKTIAGIYSKTETEIRKLRHTWKITPFVKQIDTLGAEYPAQTNYLYLTYNGSEDDIKFNRGIIVLGSGPYSIGSSVEFDWCSVNTVKALAKLGYRTIMINCNPETVSTDYDQADRLYFEELNLERVLDIAEKENPLGVILSMGGQIPNNLALPLAKNKIKILGTHPDSIDLAEDRHKFSKLLDELGIDQPKWKELTSIEEINEFAEDAGYPVIIRPSYVLSGAAMNVVEDKKYLKEYLKKATAVSKEHPVVISKFIENSKEIEMDGVAKNGEIIVSAVSEHIENAGVHSGDATIIYPVQRLYVETVKKVMSVSGLIVKALQITGPFNIQFIAKDNELKVIECNLRSSRSFPFVSKVMKTNLVDIATNVMMGYESAVPEKSIFNMDYVGVKAPQFSFTRLKGADPTSSVEMASTGEVACLGKDIHDALLKSMLSVGFKLPKKNILLSTGPQYYKTKFIESTKKLLQMGYNLYATKGTSDFLKKEGIETEALHWPLEQKKPNVMDYLTEGKIDLVINIPKNFHEDELTNDYLIRRTAVDYNVSLITNLQLAIEFVEAIYKYKPEDLEIRSWNEYG